ncbi:TonB-dependent receptor [Dysgonomonas sp. 520]|uniref:SusC/RagA family TonB-linked outer membrane protein n=1 Tax=Dysgonomonas sp. 520 TaxID=2302931 RepID=UPI0013D6920A|nr:TonB-dependent receptor [Dysgonomonas sp. 520]NDW08718.1 TonB-dependent receptor [Dysgonomonas sp. 520]
MKNALILRKKRHIGFLCLIGLLFFSFSLHSAEKADKPYTLTGTVYDSESGETIIGASVSIVGEKLGTVSDINGNFTLNASEETSQLEISFLGYKKQTIKAVAGKTVTVRLAPDNQLLNEVVVIGYGTTTRKDLTGAIGKADVKEMQKAPVSNFEEAFAGRVAGVMVTSSDGQPGSDLNIVIRGNNSVTQNNSPLYVIDGFPMETAVGNVLNSEEIESIDVLKDASATAIYGARGANGVILITTKKGKIGAPVITYNAWAGVHQIIKEQDVMSPYEFVRYQLELNPNVYSPIYLSDGKTLEDYRNEKGVNWQDQVYRDAFVQNHNISVRGGSEGTRYSISGLLTDQDGVIVNSGYKKYQGRLVLTQRISKKVSAGLNLNYTYTKKYGTVVAESQTSPTASLMYSIWGYRPVSGRESDDLLNELFDPDVNSATDFRVNPLMGAKNEFNPLHTTFFMANAYIEYNILSNLKLRVSGGYNRIDQRREIFNNSSSRLGHPNTNDKVNGSIINMDRINYLNENTLTYDKKFKSGHSLKLLGGLTIQDSYYFSSGFYSKQVPNESLGVSGLSQGIISPAPVNNSSFGLLSYLGRVDYNYKSKYLLTASFRADGSSKFPKKNRWAYFPSGSVAWRFAEENFMKNIRFVNDAKLRAGIGATGNNRVGDYSAYTSLDINKGSGYSSGNVPEKGVIPLSLGNPNLKWETTVQSNIGLDLSFLDDRITFTTDYYYKKTKDLLLKATLAPSMGYLSAYRNVGKVSNSGLEFTINTENIKTKDFTWTSNFNISFNKNKVLALNDDEPSLATAVYWGNFNNAHPYIAIPGQPIAMYYGYLFDGVYQYEDFDKSGSTYTLKPGIPNNGTPRETVQPGDIKFRDINGDGVVDNNDLTVIGNPNPKHIGGFTNNFRYKDFDLSIFLQWNYGGDVLNANRIEFEGGDPTTRSFLNMFASYANRWTPENQTNSLYRIGGQGPTAYSSRTIEDGSFLRLKTLSVGYSIPKHLLKKIDIKSLRVYASAQNLITWTNYSGLDPEVSTRPSALTPSFDWSAYPRPRVFSLGLEVTF